jgi:hypothetical protein
MYKAVINLVPPSLTPNSYKSCRAAQSRKGTANLFLRLTFFGIDLFALAVVLFSATVVRPFHT